MLKKAASIFLILVANIILLVHDVVPHHHRSGLFTFENFKNYEEALNYQHSENKHHHHDSKDEHQHNDNLSCLLKQAIIVPSSSVKFNLKCNDLSFGSYDIYSILFYSNSDNLAYFPFVRHVYKPYLSSQHPSIVNSSLGLRAPPII